MEHEICDNDADERTHFLGLTSWDPLKSLLGIGVEPNGPASLTNGASSDEKRNHKMLSEANDKEVADIKDKRINVWCHLALTLDATVLMLIRHDCVGDDGMGDGAKAWNFY